MSHQITTAFVEQFRSNVTLLSQQKPSRFAPLVRNETQTAERQAYEQIGPVSAMPFGPRHGDTPLMETPHARRWVTVSPFIWADLVDKPDRVRMLIEPTSAYTQNAVAAFNRRKDDIIIGAAIGPAYTGKDGNEVLPFPDKQKILENGPLTIEALQKIREMFWNQDVDDEQPLYMAVAPNSIVQLLQDEKVTSADFNVVRALVRGDVNSFMGFEFIRTTRLPVRMKVEGDPSQGYIRSNIAWVKDALLVATGEEITAKIGERADKKYSTQVYVSMDIGAMRMEEVKVVSLETLETSVPVRPAP